MLTIKNRELAPAIKLLNGMELKASDSRHRTKVLNLLNEAVKGLAEAELALLKECAVLDSAGKPEISESGNVAMKPDLTPEKIVEYRTEHAKLFDEEVVIDGGMYATNVAAFGKVLQEYDGVLSGELASIYDRLMDEYEKGKNNE